YVEGAVVKATVLDDTCRGKKVLVFKKKRRKGYQKLNGHRQDLTKLQINEIA
ncbi:MAG: 50S ribosomal protein L21, partial [Bacteroidetes bacterium]|nr:50S ribosomal protein L21 [Candidatus Cryptobacteroides avicola]